MRYILVNTEEDFIKMESVLGRARVISLDTETNCLDVFWSEFQVVGISLAADTQTGYYIPLGHRAPPKIEDATPPKQLSTQWVMSRLGRFLKGRRVCGANHKFDAHVFDRYRTNMGTTTFDAILAAWVYDSRDCNMGLKEITFTRLGYKPTEISSLCESVKPKGKKGSGKKGKKSKRDSIGFEFLDPELALPYAAADAVNVMRLHRWYAPRLQMDPGLSWVMDLEIALSPVVRRMEQCGMLLDKAKLRSFHDSLLEKEGLFIDLLQKVSDNKDINPRSSLQMGDLLYHQMKLPTPGGQRLFKRGIAPPKGWLDAGAIEEVLSKAKEANQDYFGDPRVKQWPKQQVIDLLSLKIKTSKIAKLRTTYTLNLVDLVSEDGRIHPEFKQLVETGRMSSGGGWNAMNLPRGDSKDTKGYDIRSAFIADEGYVFVKADYSAQELRVLAAMSNDPIMREIFTGTKKDEEGDEIDLHIYVASMAFETPYLDIKHAVQKKKRGEELTVRDKELIQFRQDAKPVSFGISYGITKTGLAEQLDKSEEFADFLITAWKTKAFPIAATWLDNVPTYAKTQMYATSYYGRKRRLSYAALNLPKWQFESRVANQLKNMPIQSTSADMTKMAMIKIDATLREELGDESARMCSMVHDEIVVLCKEEYAEQVSKIMVKEMATEINGIPIPAEASISKTLSKE